MPSVQQMWMLLALPRSCLALWSQRGPNVLGDHTEDKKVILEEVRVGRAVGRMWPRDVAG